MSRVVALVFLLAACGGEDAASPIDAPTVTDASADDASADDASTDDASTDDASTDDASTDAVAIDATPPTSDHHIHINVSNTCVMSVSPLEITIPANQTAYFDWHNHSVDYAVDVWMSYGGGFLDLPTGATWNEPVGHCGTPSVHTEYADISTACSSFRFLIRCN